MRIPCSSAGAATALSLSAVLLVIYIASERQATWHLFTFLHGVFDFSQHMPAATQIPNSNLHNEHMMSNALSML